MTSVAGLGAVNLVACEMYGASTEAGPLAYLMIVLPVQAASSAVRGLPSDHLPGLRWKVQVLPSLETSQVFAQSPIILNLVSYCTSVG